MYMEISTCHPKILKYRFLIVTFHLKISIFFFLDILTSELEMLRFYFEISSSDLQSRTLVGRLEVSSLLPEYFATKAKQPQGL